jgi:hypothetical protein
MEKFWVIDEAIKANYDDTFSKYFQIIKVENAPNPAPCEEIAKQINAAVNALDGQRVELKDPRRHQRHMEARDSYIEQLRMLADDLIKGCDTAKEGGLLRKLGEAFGKYEARRFALQRPEYAELRPPDFPTSLQFLPLQNAEPEQQALLVDIIRAMTVVDIVLDRRDPRPSFFVRIKALFSRKSDTLPERIQSSETKKLRGIYLRELKDIADEGLSSTEATAYAQRRLEAFRDAFVAREADAVKNQHVRRLGLWALTFATALLLLGLIIETELRGWFGISASGAPAIRNFLLLAAAACGGTWLSFSLRRVVLGFADLAVLEEDRLNPTGRLIFVMLLTCLIALLIEVKLLAISIGGTNVSISSGEAPALMAIVLGALCGIAERSLSGAVSRRAEEVIGSAGRVANATGGSGK